MGAERHMQSCVFLYLLFVGIIGAYVEVERSQFQKNPKLLSRALYLTSFEELETAVTSETREPTSELDTTSEGLTATAASEVIQAKANVLPSAHRLHNGPPKRLLDIPARHMWGWSPPAPKTAVGYCGEMSVQTVGLYYGNYISQDAARHTNGGPSKHHSLLLAGHHEKDSHPSSVSHALKVLNFNYSIWNDYHPQPQHSAFIEWARGAINVGEPVIFGVFMTIHHDKDYDHIVPMVGYDRNSIYFNDLLGSSTIRIQISEFVKSRKECTTSQMTTKKQGQTKAGKAKNSGKKAGTSPKKQGKKKTGKAKKSGKEASSSPKKQGKKKTGIAVLQGEIEEMVVQAPESGNDKHRYCLPASINYGIRVRGNADHDGVLLPVQLRLTTREEPDYSLEDKLHAKPVELQGTVTVTHMKPGGRYALLRYDNAHSVPHHSFLQSDYHARHDFTAPSKGKAEFKTKLMSNSTVFFRCVRIP